jgi:hypothetical protein
MLQFVITNRKIKCTEFAATNHFQSSPNPIGSNLTSYYAAGKPYRIFVKLDNQVLCIKSWQWIRRGDSDFDRDKYVRKNPTINTFLKNLKKVLDEKVAQNKFSRPEYSIPEA